MEITRVTKTPPSENTPSKLRSRRPIISTIAAGLALTGLVTESVVLSGCGPQQTSQVEMIPTPDFWGQQTENKPIRVALYEGEDLKILPQSTSRAIERKFKDDIIQAMIYDVSQGALDGYVIDESQRNAQGVSFDLYTLSNKKMVGVFPSENGQVNLAEVVGIDEIRSDGYVYRTLKIIVNNNGKDEEHTFVAFGYGQVKTAYNISSLDEETQQDLVQSQIKKGLIESIIFGNYYLSSPNAIVWIEDEGFQGQRDIALTGGFQNISYKVQFVNRPQQVITPTPALSGAEGPINTPKPPTETPTETPVGLTIEQLKGMPAELKLSAAPQATSAPADVLAAFLPAGANAADVVWGQRTLTYWERVVAYQGQVNGQEVTVYYDLESGQWAKKYDSFEQLSQIPKDQISDVMFLGDRLVRAKLQYDYDWIAQPQTMTADGKKIFRDEKGYPKAVWDTVNLTWLTPEEADVAYTLEKWKRVFDVPFEYDGEDYNYNRLFDEKRSEILTDPAQIEKLPNGTEILILNPSGEITIWSSQKDAAERAKEGATIIIGTPSALGRGYNFSSNDWLAFNVAFIEYQKGNKTIYLTYNDVGELERLQIKGVFSPGISISLDDLLKIKDKEGRIVCPVIRMPKYFISQKVTPGKGEIVSVEISNPDFWLDEIIKAGANGIIVYNLRGELENDE